jgi:hypothetical protein
MEKTTNGEEGNDSTTYVVNKLFTMIMAEKDKGVDNSY